MQPHTTTAYVRVSEIARNRRTGQPGILSVAPATWWAWVKAGKAPQPIRLSAGVTVWRRDDVIAFAEALATKADNPHQRPNARDTAPPIKASPDAPATNGDRVRRRLHELRNKPTPSQGGVA